MEQRNLDGVYFRVNRDNKWQNICYSDLTYEKCERVTEGRNAEWWRSLVNHLADYLQSIGETFNIVRKEE